MLQAVLRKWRKFGLTDAPNMVVRMTMSLPLLPEIKFEEGLLIIQREADIISNNFPNILLFMAYMRTNWLKMASRVSVHNCPVRTNNIAESFHNIAALKLGKQNINVWTFLGTVFFNFHNLHIQYISNKYDESIYYLMSILTLFFVLFKSLNNI